MVNFKDEFENAINDVEVKRESTEFKITQLKIEHFYWNSGEIDGGMPVSTSIELTCEYNYQLNKLDWKKTVVHNYRDFDNYYEVLNNKYTSVFDDEQIINTIEKYDLRSLGNNYFTDENPERFTHWEITYNSYFKIVGTFDQEISEFSKISDLLDFKDIMKKELEKIEIMLHSEE